MTFRFTLSHDILGSQVISEPDGWDGAKITLERHPDFFSLIEYYKGAANDAFIFYGNNGTENGGIDFIRNVESAYGFDADITMTVEYASDDVTYSTLFTGLLDLSEKVEMADNRMQVPVIPNDFWTKFINRMDTPISLSTLTDIDGNAVAPVGPVFVNMSGPPIRKEHYSVEADKGISVTGVVDNEYIQYTPGEFELDEMEDFYHLTPFNQTELPVSTFDVAEEGTYAFDIQWTISNIAGSTENHANGITVYLQVNFETPMTFASSDQTSDTIDFTVFTLSTTLYLLVGDQVRIYAQQAGTSQTLNWGFWGKYGLLNGPFDAPTYDKVRPSGMDEVPTFTRVTADTIVPARDVEGYLIHDLIHGVLVRMGLGNDPFYSEFLGSTLTQTKQYAADGCGWMYFICKGLQLRGYTLTAKPFFISFKQIWEGLNPILNIGLGKETVSSAEVIRIEEKGHWIGDTVAVNFSNVRDITASYDKDFIFKSIKTGYKQWQADGVSGNDAPQAKHTYATRFKKTGIDLTIESDFIAADISIGTTFRKSIEKSADYKFDDNTFIIALNTDDLSPDVYVPELDEGFSSVTGLYNAASRYNLMLTPMRNLLRWGPYISGCLQDYLSSSFKFVSGEGNYDLVTDALTEATCARAVDFTSLGENDDISPSGLGYYFRPILCEIRIPMEKTDFDLIDLKEPIGISQTDTGHKTFHIKELEYDIIKGEASIKAWPELFFTITVPEQTIADPPCVTTPTVVVYDAGYQAVLDYADTIC